MIKGILLDKTSVKVMEIEDDLQTYYKLLECDCIDIITRNIGGQVHDIICDDEGLLKNNPIPRGVDDKGREMLCGNIFICNSNNEGELTSLSDDEIKHIKQNIYKYSNEEFDIPILKYTI